MNGTKYLRVTPDQIEQIIDARIQTREEQARVESAAAPILWFKGNAAKFVVAAGVAMAGMAGAAAWSVLKSLWAKLSH